MRMGECEIGGDGSRTRERQGNRSQGRGVVKMWVQGARLGSTGTLFLQLYQRGGRWEGEVRAANSRREMDRVVELPLAV